MRRCFYFPDTYFRLDVGTTEQQHEDMSRAVAAGRHPGAGNHEIPGHAALLPGARSQAAEENGKKTGNVLTT